MLKGAVFDFDGTLFDSMYVWENAGENYLRSIGIVPKENPQRYLRTLSIAQSAVYIKENYTPWLSAEEVKAGLVRTVERFYLEEVKPKAGAAEFLEKLHSRGVKMCIATASEKYQVAAALKRCNMDKYFSEIFTCTDIGHGKDEPVIFRNAIERLGTAKESTAVFEDSLYALKTAKSDGFITVGVYDPAEEHQDEIRALADFFIEDFNNNDLFWRFADEK
ncbi:MAG: HAD family hydrolase [Acutalibacteraceae bacterium]